MADFSLTIKLADEDRPLMRELIAAMTAKSVKVIADAPKTEAPKTEAPKTAEKKPAKPQETKKVMEQSKKPEVQKPVDFPLDETPFPVDDEPKPTPAPTEEPEKHMELPAFQKVITSFCVSNPEKKGAVRGLVQEYATNVSGIPAEKREEVVQKLKAL